MLLGFYTVVYTVKNCIKSSKLESCITFINKMIKALFSLGLFFTAKHFSVGGLFKDFLSKPKGLTLLPYLKLEFFKGNWKLSWHQDPHNRTKKECWPQGFPSGSEVKNPLAMQEIWVQSLGQKDPLEEEMATHPSILSWIMPKTEEPGRRQSTGLPRVRHNWANEHTRTHKVCYLWEASYLLFRKSYSPSQASAIREQWTSRCSSWF